MSSNHKFLIIFIFFPFKILAQSQPEPEKKIPVLKEIHVEEKTEDTQISDETAFGEKLSLQEKKKFDISEAISTLPGTQIRRSGGTGQRSSISLRGTDSQQSLVLFEGIPLNSPLGGGVDYSQLPKMVISEAEVIRGGQSSQYGSDAIGGLVNLYLRPYRGKDFGEFEFSYGSFDTMETGITGGAGTKSVFMILGLARSSSSGEFHYIDDNGRDRLRTHNATTSTNFTIKGGTKFSKNSQAELVLNIFDSSKEIPGFSQFPSETAFQTDKRNILGLKYIFRTNSPAIFGNALLYTKYIQFNYEDPSPPMPPAIDSESNLITAGLKIDGKALISDSAIIFFDSFIQGDQADLYKLNTDTKYPRRISFHISTGLSYTIGNDLLIFKPAIALSDAENFNPALIPQIGAVIKPVSFFFIKGNFSKSFRYPTFEELYFDGGFIKGNPDLKPEESYGYDIGCGLDFDFLMAELAYFDLSIDNLIIFAQKSPFFIQAENSFKARSMGLETSLSIKLLKFFKIYSSYTYSYPYSERSNLRLPGRASHIFSATINSEFYNFSLYFETIGQTYFYLDRFENMKEEGRVFLNTGITYSPFAWLEGGLHFKNLLNKMDAVDYLQYPLPGFSAIGGVKIRI